MFYLNFSSNVSRQNDQSVPGPSSTSVPGPSGRGIPTIKIDEYQGAGNSVGMRGQRLDKEGPMMQSNDSGGLEFRDNSCYMTKLKCAVLVVLLVLLLGGLVAWLTVVVRGSLVSYCIVCRGKPLKFSVIDTISTCVQSSGSRMLTKSLAARFIK